VKTRLGVGRGSVYRIGKLQQQQYNVKARFFCPYDVGMAHLIVGLMVHGSWLGLPELLLDHHVGTQLHSQRSKFTDAKITCTVSVVQAREVSHGRELFLHVSHGAGCKAWPSNAFGSG
jgi:hypothetical protein